MVVVKLRPERPTIVVISPCIATEAVAGRLREVCAGIEEEGVPYTQRLDGNGLAAAQLARRAAQRSPLDVGVGVDAEGTVCVHHDKLPAPPAALTAASDADPAAVRLLGQNAARIVVGLPLKIALVLRIVD